MFSKRAHWYLPLIAVLVAMGVYLTHLYAAPSKVKPANTTAKAGKSDPFAGLPPMKSTGKEAFFRFRPGPKPPGKWGKRISLPFPPPGKRPSGRAPVVKAKPLKVLFIRPKGKVKLIGAVSVTFNQPMIPLSSVGLTKQQKVPFQIKPQPKGRFRWLGTTTVGFAPNNRMPYSTRYKVLVPKGARSVAGTRLKQARTANFETPRLKVTGQYPNRYSAERPDTWFGLRFNQDINQAKLANNLRFKGPNGKVAFAVVPVTKWHKHPRLGTMFKRWNKKRSIVLRPLKRLPKNTRFYISLRPGAYGEGPLPTKRNISKSFKTYGPMIVRQARCSSRKRMMMGMMVRCYPTTSIWFRFSNRIGPSKLKDFIKTTPTLKKLNMYVRGNYLYLSHLEGWPAASTLTITIKKGLKDIYGQALKKDYKLTVQFLDARPMLHLPRNQHATMERKSDQRFFVKMRNIFTLRTRMKWVKPEDVPWIRYVSHRVTYYSYRNRNYLQGIKFDVDSSTKTGLSKNKIHTREVSLRAFTKGRSGFVLVVLTSNELMANSRYASPHRALLVQVTDAGITARYSISNIAMLLTRLSNGAPIKNAKVKLYQYKSRRYRYSKSTKPKLLWTGKTDSRGYAVLPGPARKGVREGRMIVVDNGKDKAYALLGKGGSSGYTYGYSAWSRIPKKYVQKYYLFTDRNPYKPGEMVHVRGMMRRGVMRPRGGIVGLPQKTATIHYNIMSPRWKIVKKGKVKLQAGGTFSIDYKLKELADLGTYRVRGWLKQKGQRFRFYGNFQVQAYRAPEYKVTVSTVQKGPFFYKDKVATKVEGRYTFGAAMRGARVSWQLRRKRGYFAPPNQPAGFRFGVQRGYRWHWRRRFGYRGRRYGSYYRYRRNNGTKLKSGTGKLNDKGHLTVSTLLTPGKEKTAYLYVLEAQVYDKNRQSIAGRKTILAHAASLYVGIHSKKPIIKAGKKSMIEAVVVSVAGKRQASVPIELQVLQRRTKRIPRKKHGAWTFTYKTKEVKVAGCKMMSAKDIVSCAIRVPQAGYYILKATVKDPAGRTNTTRMGIYAYGKTYVPWKTNNSQRIELIADRKLYKPGQWANILIKSPFRKARGILTIERNGIAEHRPIVLTGSAQAIKVKVRREYLPNFWVAVSLASGRVPLSKLGLKAGQGAEDLGRPAFAFGQAQLNVSLTEKQIGVSIKTSKETIRPGGSVTIKLKTTDHRNRPVKGIVTVALVDEGVLSLLGFKTPAPLRKFHTPRQGWAQLKDIRAALLRRKPKKKKRAHGIRRRKYRIATNKRARNFRGSRTSGGLNLADASRAPGSSSTITGTFASAPKAAVPARLSGRRKQESSNSPGQKAFSVRTRFATTAFYKAMVKTNGKGEATLKVKMPDNLTTFRIMAVAVDTQQLDRFGHGEGRVIVRKPLLLRPALPRFANYGDKFEASVVINNETGKTGTVQVFARGINIAFTGKRRTSITIPAGESREVRFPVAVQKTGSARIQFAAVMDKETDAVERQIPVLMPATAEAFATYGTTNSSVAQPIAPPNNAIPQFGGLKISMSSTALNGLEDAVRYLVDYPFECTEQTASRAMPIFALQKILPAFKIGKVSDKAKMKRLANNAITKLVRRQRYDGGWGYWGGSRRSYMYISSYVTYALLRAREAGYNVPGTTMRKAARFLRRRLNYSPFQWERKNPTLRSMAVWVLSEIKPNVQQYLGGLYSKRNRMPLFAKAWLMVALHRHKQTKRMQNMLRILNNAAIQLPGRVHFSEKKTESLRMLMHSEDRTDAIVLGALLEVQPKHPLVPKVVRGLMRSRIRGRWSTTQSNAFAMLGVSKYFDIYEKIVPNFTIQSWLGNGYLGTAKMKGRSMTITDQKIPMSFLQKQGKKNLILAKKGKGRLYYRIGVRYAPKNLRLPSEEQGFSVTRTYEGINKGDVKRTKDGRWIFKAGAYIRVRLRIIATGQRYYVAVVDPLPAGLEAVNLAFKTSASAALRQYQTRRIFNTYSWYSFFAFNHHEKRDSMVVLFANRLPAGIYEYNYVARATTIGQFVIPPTRAEEMYSPEIFGRNATNFAEVRQP